MVKRSLVVLSKKKRQDFCCSGYLDSSDSIASAPILCNLKSPNGKFDSQCNVSSLQQILKFIIHLHKAITSTQLNSFNNDQ